MIKIRLNLRHGKNAHLFCQVDIFISSKEFSALESAFTTLHKFGKVTKNSMKCHKTIFVGQLLALYMAKLLYSMSKCSLKPLETMQISQNLHKIP